MPEVVSGSTAARLQEQLIASILSSLVPAHVIDDKKRRKEDPPSLNVAILAVCPTMLH